MTIQIIGGGAVGLLLASFFAEKKYVVEVVSKREQQCEALRAYGLIRTSFVGDTETFPLGATLQLSEQPDFIVVATKYEALVHVYPLLEKLPATIPILFIQNGLAHYEEALRLPQQHIAFGSVQFGAQRENDYTVIQRGKGVLKVAIARGDVEKFSIIETLQSDLLPIQYEVDAEKMLFEKALLNCFINPLTAILKVKNGELLTNKHAYALLNTLYKELTVAFPSMCRQFPFDSVTALCKKTAANTSSMLADRLAGRKTEVETIVGAILQKAARENKQLPTLRTLYEMIKAIEHIESGDEM